MLLAASSGAVGKTGSSTSPVGTMVRAAGSSAGLMGAVVRVAGTLASPVGTLVRAAGSSASPVGVVVGVLNHLPGGCWVLGQVLVTGGQGAAAWPL